MKQRDGGWGGGGGGDGDSTKRRKGTAGKAVQGRASEEKIGRQQNKDKVNTMLYIRE